MDSINCFICNIEKSIDKFYNKYRECKQWNNKRSLRHYYENEDKLSIQRKIYYGKNRDVLLAKATLNQQSRKHERKIYKQQIQEFNEKLRDLTQAFEMLETPNS